jgi:hypothetical protein
MAKPHPCLIPLKWHCKEGSPNPRPRLLPNYGGTDDGPAFLSTSITITQASFEVNNFMPRFNSASSVFKNTSDKISCKQLYLRNTTIIFLYLLNTRTNTFDIKNKSNICTIQKSYQRRIELSVRLRTYHRKALKSAEHQIAPNLYEANW